MRDDMSIQVSDNETDKRLDCHVADAPRNDSNCHLERSERSQNETVFSRKRVAFTLAEVLITLGIIGVVASMTLVPLINNYRERAEIVKLKKVYSTLSTAFNTAVEENGDVNTWSNGFADSTVAIDNVMHKYFKYVRYCGYGNKRNKCMSPEYKKTDGTSLPLGQNPFNSVPPKYYLTDGSVIVINAEKGDYEHLWCKYPVTNSSSAYDRYMYKCGKIYVDTNGSKGPNRNGFDLFVFVFYQNTILPLGVENDHPIENFEACTGKSSYGFALGSCAAWALFNENMDYLHCPEKLSWKGKHTCK